MPTTEMNTAGMQGEQDNMSTPPVLNETSAPLNFSELTPRQFGISPQSFIPSSSNCKSTSRLAQLKARRRSSVGVRGSPETNSLIRFMAQERMKTPPAHQTSEHVKSSPFLPRVTSTLRQKMAAFQSLMDVEETEACDQMPRQDSDGGSCIKTRAYVPDCNTLSRGKENNAPMTLKPSKRRCLGLLEGCEVEIREDSDFELQSPRQTPTDDPAAISPAQLVSPFHIASLPSLWEMEPTAKDDPCGTSAEKKKKKKKVCFGGPLSPEFFDKKLPPSTPLQKGGTPARAPTPGGALRSVLKTPQRIESDTSPAQPDFSSPAVFGASPVLAMSRKSRITSDEKDNEERKIVFPSMEEFDSAMTSCTAEALEAEPLSLNGAFLKESPFQFVTELETKHGEASQMDELATFPDKEPEAPVKSQKQKKELPGPECESTSVAPTRSRPRKRKPPQESKPVKRLTRSAAMLASGRIKITSTATCRWNRDVDRSLYGSRKYASKNPGLSPITESLSLCSQATAALALPTSSAAFTGVTAQDICLNPEMANYTVEEHTVASALKDPSDGSVTSTYSGKKSTTREGRRLSGPRVRGRRLKQSNIGDGDSDLLDEEPRHQTGGEKKQQWEEETEAGNKIPPESTVPDQGGVEIDPNSQICAHPHSIDSDSTQPGTCLPSGEELSCTLNLPEEAAPEEQVKSCSVSQTESMSSPEDEAVTNVHLAPWQADFNPEDVFKPVSFRVQRSVRRSLRIRKRAGNNNSAGLAWVAWVSPDSIQGPRRRTRGRRLSAALAIRPSLEESLDNMS